MKRLETPQEERCKLFCWIPEEVKDFLLDESRAQSKSMTFFLTEILEKEMGDVKNRIRKG